MVGSYKWYWWFLSFFLASCLSEGCLVTVAESGKERQFSVKRVAVNLGGSVNLGLPDFVT